MFDHGPNGPPSQHILLTLTLDPAFAQILNRFLTNQQEIKTLMSVLDDKITALQADVAAETSVNQSAITLIQGIPQMIADAVAAAQAQGATPAQLQAFTDLQTALEANTSSLSAAVTAGTPAATT
jgi:hypothetical protein